MSTERMRLPAPKPEDDQLATPPRVIDQPPSNEQARHERGNVVVLAPMPHPIVRPHAPTQRERTAVHIAPDLHALVKATPLATVQALQASKESHDLNAVVHKVLIVGLAISATLMLIGIALDLSYQSDLPSNVPALNDIGDRVLRLRPSGFLTLGLLMLIATPILRVAGSIGAFLYERDWTFVAVTTLVLVILITSIVLGAG